MHSKGAGAVNRVELECQVLCAALRQSWVRKDKVGAFTSIRELSHLFPDLLPPPEERDGSNKANYYDMISIRPGSGLNGIVVGYLRTVRKFLRENNPKDHRQFYNALLNAGFVLRKPRLRLSHDLVVARRWLYESQLDDDEPEEVAEELAAVPVATPLAPAPIPAPAPVVPEPAAPPPVPEPASEPVPAPLPPPLPSAGEPAPVMPAAAQTTPVPAEPLSTHAAAAHSQALPEPVAQPVQTPVQEPAPDYAAVSSPTASSPAAPMLGSTYDPLASIENSYSSAIKQPSSFVAPEPPAASTVLDNSGAPPVVPAPATAPPPALTAGPETIEVSRPEAAPPPLPPVAETAPLAPPTPAEIEPPRPAEEPRKAQTKSREFVFDENQLRKPEADIELPSVIRLMEASHLITKVEVQALKAQMQLAPNIAAEQLCLNAGYISKNEIASVRLAQDLLSSGKITMAQFQVAMYDERTSGLRMAESLQVRGWLETEVKNPMET